MQWQEILQLKSNIDKMLFIEEKIIMKHRFGLETKISISNTINITVEIQWTKILCYLFSY